jgi:hypothetical protein
VSAAFIVAFATTIMPGGARAADDCVATPNAQAPQGSHWYYHVDRATHRACWYLGPQGQKVHHAASKAPAADESTARPESEIVGDHAAPPTQVEPSSPQAWPATAGVDTAHAGRQGIVSSSLQGAALSVQWPEPPQPAVTGGHEDDGGSAFSAQEMPDAASADVPDVDQPDEALARPVAGRAANPATAMFMRILLLVAGALAAAGILQQAIFKIVFAPRRRVYVERDQADRPFNGARDEMAAMFAASRPGDRMRAPIERIDPQVVEDAMQQILRSMERRAA